MLLIQGMQFGSLAGELQSHTLHDVAQKKNKCGHLGEVLILSVTTPISLFCIIINTIKVIVKVKSLSHV